MFLHVVIGVDQQDEAMAGAEGDRQHAARYPTRAGQVPRLPTQAEAAQAGGQSTPGEQLQHPADTSTTEQPTGIHAHRGKDGHRE